ncbi:polysaccharide deacetylase family protein [Candidatus Uhrbacteria bacterium]|nr:polysaccharide deacetylase family protein [Candidatus Uhrbacteria bacterium]
MRKIFIGVFILFVSTLAGIFVLYQVYNSFLTAPSPLAINASFDEYVCRAWPNCAIREPEPSFSLEPSGSYASGTVIVPIVMYHHIRAHRPWFNSKERLYSVTPDVFASQMQALKDAGYTPITPDDLIYAITTSTRGFPEKPVLITLDDGHREHFTEAFPVLKRLDLKATFFIITDSMKLNGYMTADQIREVDQSGIITIGSHTRSHAALTRYGGDRRSSEISGSKRDLEDLLGHPIQTIAYPYGYSSAQIEREVRDAGYALGFSIGPGAVHSTSTRYHLRRIQINQDTDLVRTLDRYREHGK